MTDQPPEPREPIHRPIIDYGQKDYATASRRSPASAAGWTSAGIGADFAAVVLTFICCGASRSIVPAFILFTLLVASTVLVSLYYKKRGWLLGVILGFVIIALLGLGCCGLLLFSFRGI